MPRGYNQLIADLRDPSIGRRSHEVRRKAANAIETLAAENEALRAAFAILKEGSAS